MVEDFLFALIDVLLTLYDTYFSHVVLQEATWVIPLHTISKLKVHISVDHLTLSVVGFIHTRKDVLVRLITHKSKRIDFVTCDCLELADLVEDVLWKVLAPRVQNVLLVPKDVGVGTARGIVPQLAFSRLHSIIIKSKAIGIHRRNRSIQQITNNPFGGDVSYILGINICYLFRSWRKQTSKTKLGKYLANIDRNGHSFDGIVWVQ